jgi:argininosuccinate synthase
MDLGQGKGLEDVRDRALAGGAVRAHVLDVREEFARDYVLRALQADAMYEDRYPMGRALGRPLIAKKLVEIAAIEQAAAIAHGSTGEGFDIAARALNPAIVVVAPARDWGMTRSEEIEYARTRGISLPATVDSPYSTDANLWDRSIKWGGLDDASTEPPEEIYTLTRRPADCPDEPAYVELAFERGVPTAINGVAMPFVELIASLGTIAGAHGVGRIDMVENRLAAVTSREMYEAPASLVLHMAHKELQRMVSTKDAARFSRAVSLQYADVVYNGLWFTPLREALDAYVAKIQERVGGVIRLKLFKGDCRVVAFDHAVAPGFIKILGLSGETAGH